MPARPLEIDFDLPAATLTIVVHPSHHDIHHELATNIPGLILATIEVNGRQIVVFFEE